MTSTHDPIIASMLVQLRNDPHGFHTRIIEAPDETAAVVIFCRFLEVYPSLRALLTFENISPVLERVLGTIRADTDTLKIYHCTQLIRETFLLQQLQQKRKKIFSLNKKNATS